MTERVPTTELSEAFFGRKHRLTVWHAVMQRSIEPPEHFRARDIYRQLGEKVNEGIVGQEVRALAIAGLIARVVEPADTSHQSKYYQRLDSLLWSAIDEFASRSE